METVLQGLPSVSIYLDDILVTGKSVDDHIRNLEAVLSRLEDAGFRLKQEKRRSCYLALNTWDI